MSRDGAMADAADILARLWSVCNQPVRLTIQDPTSRERLQRVQGIVYAVDPAGLIVECFRPAASVAPDMPVAVEILAHGHISWFHTAIGVRCWSDRERLHLRLPTAIHTLQRRKYPRVDVDIPVHLLSKSTGKTLPAALRDLSAGGASLRSSEPLATGERVLLVFQLGSGLFFQDLEGETLRATQLPDGTWTLGLRFQCSEAQARTIADWVIRHAEGSP